MEKMRSVQQRVETEPYFEQTREYVSDLRALVMQHFGDREDRLAIFRAIDFCLCVHADQPRPDGPYVNHPLRAALMLVRDFEVRDCHLIIAELCHDSVEDVADKVVEFHEGPAEGTLRERAFETLQREFGEKVRRLVSAVTYPEELKDDRRTPAENNAEFEGRTTREIRDPEVAMMKFADYYDNALRLHPTNPPLPPWLVEKYLPMADVFSARLQEEDVPIPLEVKQRLVQELDHTRERMTAFLDLCRAS